MFLICQVCLHSGRDRCDPYCGKPLIAQQPHAFPLLVVDQPYNVHVHAVRIRK